jgi:hypothetical protein
VLEVAELAWEEFGGELSIRHPHVELDEKKLFNDLLRVVTPMKRHASLMCYQLIDEPPAELLPKWKTTSRILGAIDPRRPSFSCLCREDLLPVAADMGMQMIVFDRYPLFKNIQPGEYDFNNFIALLETLKANAQEIPYWMVIQAFASPAGHRYPTPAELRLMTDLSLAHNAKGIFYFLYNSKTQTERLQGLVDTSLQPAGIFDEVSELARELKQLRHWLLGLSPIDTRVSGPEKGFEVKMFEDVEGAQYVVVCNLDVLGPAQFLGKPQDAFSRAVNLLTSEEVAMDTSGVPQFAVNLGPGEGCVLKLEE